jgi:hypothetical protein
MHRRIRRWACARCAARCGALALLLVLASSWTPPARADYWTAAVTGDSQADSYAFLMPQEMMRIGLPPLYFRVTSGGATSSIYLGQETDTHATPPRAHNFAADAIAGGADVVLVTLGDNEAFQNQFDLYADNMTEIVSQLLQDLPPERIVLSTNIPILDNPDKPYYAEAGARLRDQFNPFVRELAAATGASLVDLETTIQQQPDWQSWYSEDIVHPGFIHLWARQGQDFPGLRFVASQFAEKVAALFAAEQNTNSVPEPATWTLLALAPIVWLAARRGGRRGASG